MTSRHESFCLAALEALACGVPVLAPRVGGLPEVVQNGHSGFLYPKNRPERAVELALDFFSRPTLQKSMRCQARRQAQKFELRRITARYEQLYRTLLL